MSYNPLRDPLRDLTIEDFAISQELWDMAAKAKFFKITAMSQKLTLGGAGIQYFLHTQAGKVLNAINTEELLAVPLNTAEDDQAGVRGEGPLVMLIDPSGDNMLIEADVSARTNFGKPISAATIACSLGIVPSEIQYSNLEQYWDNPSGFTEFSSTGVIESSQSWHSNGLPIPDDSAVIHATYNMYALSDIITPETKQHYYPMYNA